MASDSSAPSPSDDYDFIVVGSGAGAVCAALVVAAKGGRPLILEKTALFGGSTALSGGVIWTPNTQASARTGVEDTADDARAYLDACAGVPTPGSTLARRAAYLEKGPQAVAFVESQGVKFRHVDGYADYHHGEYPGGLARGRSLIVDPLDLRRLGPWAARLRMRPGAQPPVTMADVAPIMLKGRTLRSLVAMVRVGLRMVQNRLGRRLVGIGAALQGRLLEVALRRSIPIWLNSEVTGLTTEGDRVAGVVVSRDGQTLRLRARRGVLIDAGGFSHDAKMRERHQPKGVDPTRSMANPGDTGEMIAMALDLGAQVDSMELSWWLPTSRTPEGAMLTHSGDMAKPHGVLVDQSARRFVNEATSYVAWGLAYFERTKDTPGAPCWFIFDRNFVDKYRFSGIDGQPFWAKFGLGEGADRFPASWHSSGYLKMADTLEGLAQQCALPIDQLRATLERFNSLAERGVDEDFGRGGGAFHLWAGDPTHKPNANLAPVARPPFYAIAIAPGDVGTAGGLIVDEAGRVLHENGRPIPGLYATGNATASVFGRSYPGAGASIGASLVFGYLAAENAMAERF